MPGRTTTCHEGLPYKCDPAAERLATNKRQHGVTLIELLVVIGIAAILMALAVPSFQNFLNRQRLEGTASEMVTDIQYARSEAVARNVRLRISFGTDANGSCYLVHTGGAGDCTCSSHGTVQCSDTNALTFKSIGLPAARGVHLQANVSSMVFDPVRGTATPAGSINFSDNDGKTIRHIVNIMGRTRTCSPHSAVSGYKAC